MGMGEPLDNVDEVLRSLEVFTAPWGLGFGAKRITVSTIGVIPGMERFLAESSCHLAVSLHSPFDEERRRLMPIEHIYPIRDVLETIRRAEFGRQRRVSFEYIVFRGLNHSRRHVKELARILQGIRCRVNLIRFHRVPGAPLEPADHPEMVEFQHALKAKGIPTTIRASRGEDVQAACGMLSTRRLVKTEPEDY
jgi:23S rRNA (adenine2503-C2)-methyltransferase